MKTKAKRAAEQRKRQRGRKRPRRQRRAASDFANRFRWRDEGLEETPTEEIVTTLAGLGIQTDDARFREQALAHKTVDELAFAWLDQSTAAGFWEDYPWLAAKALWSRWTPDLFSIELFIERNLPQEAFRGQSLETSQEAQRHWQMARAVIDLVSPVVERPRPDLWEELKEHSGIDIAWWLTDLPLDLAGLGMVDEAIELCSRMARVDEATSFLGDRAEILAEAGRREEALRQVEANLAQFPDDVWVRMRAGHVYEHFGNLTMAETVYRQALTLTDEVGPSYEREEAVARLADLLHEAGRVEEAEALIEAEEVRDAELEKVLDPGHGEDLHTEDEEGPDYEGEPTRPATTSQTVRREGPKVGRNDPCPCGSERKFKRCCGR